MEFRGLMAFGAWRYGLAVWPYSLTATRTDRIAERSEFRAPEIPIPGLTLTTLLNLMGFGMT